MKTDSNIVTRAEASKRLVEASHKMFANGIDDLALLAVLGSILTAAFEELDTKTVKVGEHPLNGFFDAEKDGFARWFNFLKHGAKGARSPGPDFDFSFLGDQSDRDEILFALIWRATLYHLSAYECSSELINAILITGQALWGDDEEEEIRENNHVLHENIRRIARDWYSRNKRAEANGVDVAQADAEVSELFAGPVAAMLGTHPKLPDRNRKDRKR
jgi:hypothetical protein